MVINFTYDGTNYTLEYTRRTARELQLAGFDDSKIDTQSLVMIPLLVKYAFKAHHANLRGEVIDTIYDSIGNKAEFIKKLAEMYYDTVATLADEPDNSGKVEWTVS